MGKRKIRRSFKKRNFKKRKRKTRRRTRSAKKSVRKLSVRMKKYMRKKTKGKKKRRRTRGRSRRGGALERDIYCKTAEALVRQDPRHMDHLIRCRNQYADGGGYDGIDVPFKMCKGRYAGYYDCPSRGDRDF